MAMIGGDGSAATAQGVIKDSNTKNFMVDVIEASRQAPVLVDFWAPWCGPCKQLGPLLEKIVKEAKGAVRLVKINVDENQQLAAQMRIQSIPAVFAFANGQPVDGFMGALPESELRQFITRITAGAKGDEVGAMLEAAEQALAANDLAAAGQLFAQVLQIDRENIKAIAGLASAQIRAGDIEAAKATLALVPPSKASHPDVASVRAQLDLAGKAIDPAAIKKLASAVERDPADFQSRYDFAVALNSAGRREEALDQLLAIIGKQRNWNDDAARKQLVQFFDAWGPKDALTLAGRRKLSSLLFS
ncbi:MAG TPA: thioredoxin [Aestuariivirgaceae bacterium]